MVSLEAFLRQLHVDTDEARPPDWEVDWADAPLAYKLYRGLPTVPLSADVPLTLPVRAAPPPFADGESSPRPGREGRPLPPGHTAPPPSADRDSPPPNRIASSPAGSDAPARPRLRDIGHLLWHVFGLARLSQSAAPAEFAELAAGPWHLRRRFVPSGGALYPSELYMYLKLEDLPAGVYHYDAAHHRLVMLRAGEFDSYLARTLGNRCDMPACFGVVFVSTMFWKNFFKYYNFAYRLQGLDAGVLIGQLLEVAERFGYAAGVYYQFLDRAVNHLLGISEREESVYAVVPLSTRPASTWFAGGSCSGATIAAADCCRELPEVRHDHFVRSRKMMALPLITRMNEASLMESTGLFRHLGGPRRKDGGEQALALPRVRRLAYVLAPACRMRYSPEKDFVLGKVSRLQLAALLQEATSSFVYRSDLDGVRNRFAPRVSLYGCLYSVEGVPDGAYRYDYAAHALRRVRPGDQRRRLQQALSLDNVNLFQVPLCLHVAGDSDHLTTALGYRGYRIQQMEAGMLVQRLLLTASALEMGGHPLLGFDTIACDELYKLNPLRQTCLIQLPVGPFRPRPRLEGSLHH